jgi:hypothetical protein
MFRAVHGQPLFTRVGLQYKNKQIKKRKKSDGIFHHFERTFCATVQMCMSIWVQILLPYKHTAITMIILTKTPSQAGRMNNTKTNSTSILAKLRWRQGWPFTVNMIIIFFIIANTNTHTRARRYFAGITC